MPVKLAFELPEYAVKDVPDKDYQYPILVKETLRTHGEAARDSIQVTKPKVWKKIQDFLKDPNNPKRIPSVDVSYSSVCNFACDFCFETAYQNGGEHRVWDIPALKQVMDEADELGAFAISLQGGEPLVFKDLEEVIKAIGPDRFMISMVTNGFYLEQKAQQLKDWGVYRICVSIDSGIPEEHDKGRKMPNAYKKAMAGIDKCLSIGLIPHLHTVVTHTSLYSDGFNSLVNYVYAKNMGLSIMIAMPVGEWKMNREDLVTVEDVKYLQRLHQAYPHIRRDNTPAHGVDTGCRAVTYQIYISSEGQVKGCPFLPMNIANVFQVPLSEVMRRGHRVREFTRRTTRCLSGEDRDFIDKFMVKGEVSLEEAGFDLKPEGEPIKFHPQPLGTLVKGYNSRIMVGRNKDAKFEKLEEKKAVG